MTTIINKQAIDMENTYENISKSRSKFWILMLGFMALIYVRNIMKIEFPIIIPLVYICFMAFLSDRDEIVALGISLVPFSSAFQYRYALLCLMVIYTVKFIDDVKRSKINVYIPLVLMMVWEVLHVFSGEFSFVAYFQGFSELIFCTFIISLPKKNFDFSFLTRVLAITIVFACSITFFKLLDKVNYRFEALFLDGKYRFGSAEDEVKSYAMSYNANALGFMCNLGISALFLRMKKLRVNFVDILLISAMVFYGLLTLARSFVICLALLLVMFMFASENRPGKVIKNIATITILSAVLLFVLNLVVPYVFENILARFNEDDVTGGRTYLMQWYGEQIFKNPKIFFFGTGIQNLVANSNELAHIEVTSVPHNGMQEVMAAWGLPGFVIFTAFCIVMISASKKKGKRRNMLNFMPSILMFVMIQSGQLITSGFKLVAFVFLYVTLCAEIPKEKNSKKAI